MGTFYLKQLLVGREVGRGDRIGTQMQNFVYLVGDRDAGECLVVDPAWDVDGIIQAAQADDMNIASAWPPCPTTSSCIRATPTVASTRRWARCAASTPCFRRSSESPRKC